MSLTLIEEVRLNVGDFSAEFSILPDEAYQHFLNKYDGNVNRASVDAARSLLFELTRWPTRERTGSIEVWNEWANAYRRALEMFLKDPTLSLSNHMPYAGGISKSDMKANDSDRDNVRPRVYSGMSVGRKVYNNKDRSDEDESTHYGY